MTQAGTMAIGPYEVAFDKRGCEGLLRKNPGLEQHATHTIISQLENNLFKSKFATSARWEGLPLWECRINAGPAGPFRAAFAVKGRTATVVYLSRTLQKRSFTAELDRFLGRR